MLSKLNAQGRIWLLLIAWILFTGFGVADLFDLSDDIVLPTAIGQLAVAPDSVEEHKPHAFVLNVCEFEPQSLSLGTDPSTLFLLPFTQRDTPLYQRHSVYRI